MFHQVYIRQRDITEPKRHHKELIGAVTNHKYGLREVPCPNPQLIAPIS